MKLGQDEYQKLFELALQGSGKMLKAYSNFHRYSYLNQMFAFWQMLDRNIDVSPIATYKQWLALGRQVKKGEKAIALRMPVTKKAKEEGGKDEHFFIFRNNWFAMSQTDGEEVQFPAIEFDYDKALEVLGIVKENFKHTNGNAQGYAKKGVIAINPLAELPAKTFFHEVAHNILHLENDAEFVDDKTTEANIQEVEAEGVALCVSLALGLEENVPYCVGYIRNWNTNNEIPVDSIKRIFRATDKILKAGQDKPDKGEEKSSS